MVHSGLMKHTTSQQESLVAYGGTTPGDIERKSLSITLLSWAICLISPVLIRIDDDSDLISHAQSDGDDIVFTDYFGNQLDHQIELFDDASGDLVAWVRVPQLVDFVNTTLYMYYGNPSSDNQENIEGVWSAGYQGIWHLHDDFLDSTSYDNDGTNHGSI